MERQKTKRRATKKNTRKGTNRTKTHREHSIKTEYITNYQTSESIVKIILDKIINLSIRQSRLNKINTKIKDYCFEFIQNQIEPLFEEKYINYTKINNNTDCLFWKNQKPKENQWVEITEPDVPKDDRFEGVFIHYKEIEDRKKLKINKFKEGVQNELLNIIYNEKESNSKGDLEKNDKSKQSKKKLLLIENNEKKNKDLENINKIKPVIQPAKANRKNQILDFPSVEIPDIEKEFNHEEFEPPNINILRKEREENKKKKEREAKLREEEKKIVKKKDDSDKTNKKQRPLDSNKFTFDSNGKIISFKPYKFENLSKDFHFIKNSIKDNNDSIKAGRKKKISLENKKEKINKDIIKNPVKEEKIEKMEKISEKNRDKIIPSGSNFQIILPNIGVVIKENQNVKKGGREFNKYFNKYSISDYDKILNEYAPLQYKTQLKNKMNKMNLTTNINLPTQKKSSESVDNQRMNSMNNILTNIDKTYTYNYNYNSNDNLIKNPLLTTNDNIQININDTDNNINNNSSSTYLRTSAGINSFNKNSNNYNPLMTSFNLRSAFINMNNMGKRGTSFNDSITMKKAGVSSLKLEIDSMADLKSEKTYYGPQNVKKNNIFGRNFMKNYKIALFKPPMNNSLNVFNKNILGDSNWGNKEGGEKGQSQEKAIYAKHHSKQQALRELGSNILSGIKVRLPRDRKVEINTK